MLFILAILPYSKIREICKGKFIEMVHQTDTHKMTPDLLHSVSSIVPDSQRRPERIGHCCLPEACFLAL
jgi:hypothetical protein